MSTHFTEADIDESESLLWTGKQSYANMAVSIALGLILAPVGLGLLILLNVYMTLEYTSYAVTDKALYKKKGVLSDKISRVPLNKIQNTEYSRSWAEKQFGYGTVEISTAGSDGSQLRFRAIEDPKEIQEKINSLTKNVNSKKKPETTDIDTEQIAAELRETRENIEDIADYLNNK